jgi:hypothetical protein
VRMLRRCPQTAHAGDGSGGKDFGGSCATRDRDNDQGMASPNANPSVVRHCRRHASNVAKRGVRAQRTARAKTAAGRRGRTAAVVGLACPRPGLCRAHGPLDFAPAMGSERAAVRPSGRDTALPLRASSRLPCACRRFPLCPPLVRSPDFAVDRHAPGARTETHEISHAKVHRESTRRTDASATPAPLRTCAVPPWTYRPSPAGSHGAGLCRQGTPRPFGARLRLRSAAACGVSMTAPAAARPCLRGDRYTVSLRNGLCSACSRLFEREGNTVRARSGPDTRPEGSRFRY